MPFSLPLSVRKTGLCRRHSAVRGNSYGQKWADNSGKSQGPSTESIIINNSIAKAKTPKFDTLGKKIAVGEDCIPMLSEVLCCLWL